MDIKEMLNHPGEQPRRRPRPSFSTQNSQSPATDYHRQSSLQTNTPISPPGPSSAHGSVSQGYFDRAPPALPSTPSSPHTRNPLVATPHSVNPHTPVDTPNASAHSHVNASHRSPHRDPPHRKREKSLSVSPKTVVSKLPSHPAPPRFDPLHPPPQRQGSEDVIMGNHTTVDSGSAQGTPGAPYLRQDALAAAPVNTSKRQLADDTENPIPSAAEGRMVKRRRLVEIPIWARPAKKVRPLPKYATNGANPALVKPDAAPKTEPEFDSDGPLGPFEESFRGPFVPHEELTKQICDFLFQHVVLNDSTSTGRVGETAKVEGQLEIEAKIGTIIDKRTGERLELPIISESIIRPNFDVAFESMMTEQQHKYFNNLLNESLKASHGPPVTARRNKAPKPRIQMNYQHRHEVDTFYDLPGDEVSNLPQSLQSLLRQHPARKPKLRVTRLKKTGEVIAKIVKARISDLHVASPSSNFDWRVSVSLEANWDGNLDALIQAAGDGAGNGRKAQPDRHKDRMSYTHLFCQVDLTQVKSQSAKGLTDVTHELEVELDSSAVREQGQLVVQGLDNQYQDLVKAFVDNVRILTREVT